LFKYGGNLLISKLLSLRVLRWYNYSFYD
jgi:hypothetical protein